MEVRRGARSIPTLGAPKTTRSRRTIALPPQVVDILARRVTGMAPEDFVFTNTAGRPWRRNRWHETVWQPALRAANQHNATPRPLGKTPRVHDMRHTCASWMIRAGLPLPVIQRHLGHESITTTVDRYGHMEPAHLAMAAGALGAALGAALPEP
ncbi:tyrosine-type recombinase/integrase [Cellulosimicrobium sp. Marseille-Q8652]